MEQLQVFLPIINQLQKLFDKYLNHRPVFDDVLDAIGHDDAMRFKSLVLGRMFFGGPGALWEVRPVDGYEERRRHTDAPAISDAEAAADQEEYQRLFIALIDELARAGMGNGRVGQVRGYVTAMGK